MQTESRSQRIAVTGATGRVGLPLVEILERRGRQVVPISRSKGVDVITGDGLEEALSGVETIVDAATGPSPDEESATEFFTTSARNIQRAGAAAGARGMVAVSIIGIDKFEHGYNAAKLAQEQALLEGPLPVRIVRAAQFHEFIDSVVGWTIQDGVAHVPEMRTQPVAARVVAETLADAAEEPEIEKRQDHRGRRPAGRASRRPRGRAIRQPGRLDRDPREPPVDLGASARRPGRRGLRGGRRAAQPGREARRPELRGVARGGLGHREQAKRDKPYAGIRSEPNPRLSSGVWDSVPRYGERRTTAFETAAI
jgi:uncharacterized protein YbjT (DUF2867 family)